MKTKLKEIQNLAIKDLQISKPEHLKISSIDQLKAWLTKEIRILIDQDFQQLLNILYRIDIKEEKAKEAFSSLNPAEKLAELIIEREQEKIKSREKYRGKKSNP